jgi:hypothetical protein
MFLVPLAVFATRSITEYLKSHNVDITAELTSAEPNTVFFESWQEGGVNEGKAS